MKNKIINLTQGNNGTRKFKQKETAQLGIAAVIGSLSQFNTRSKRLVKVRTNDELFEGELTQIAWDIDHWIGMVDGEWFTLSEINCL